MGSWRPGVCPCDLDIALELGFFRLEGPLEFVIHTIKLNSVKRGLVFLLFLRFLERIWFRFRLRDTFLIILALVLYISDLHDTLDPKLTYRRYDKGTVAAKS